MARNEYAAMAAELESISQQFRFKLGAERAERIAALARQIREDIDYLDRRDARNAAEQVRASA